MGANHHPSPAGGEPSTSARLTERSVIEAGFRGDAATLLLALDAPLAAIRAAGVGGAARMALLDAPMTDRLLTDPDVSVRRRTLEAVSRLPWAAGDTQLARAIIAAVARPDADGPDADSLTELAAFTLGELGVTSPEVTDWLGETARSHHDHLCREAAVAALGALHTGRTVILAALDDRATVRRRAVIALAAFDDDEVTAALEAALEDRDWQVRQIAEDLLSTQREELGGEPDPTGGSTDPT